MYLMVYSLLAAKERNSLSVRLSTSYPHFAHTFGYLPLQGVQAFRPPFQVLNRTTPGCNDTHEPDVQEMYGRPVPVSCQQKQKKFVELCRKLSPPA